MRNSGFTSTNHTHQATPFSFEYLWPIAVDIYQNNPRNSSLYHPHDNQSRICLTYDACVAHVGTGYTLYSRQDVYDRVILWRIPLIALIFTATLPALGFPSQAFTIFHLIADPIDTLWSLFYRLHLARRHAKWAIEEDQKSHFTFNEYETVVLEDPNDGEQVRLDDLSENSHQGLQDPQPGQARTQIDESESMTEVQQPDHMTRPYPVSRLHRVQTPFIGRQKQQEVEENQRSKHSQLISQYDCNVLALIVDAYHEWGYGQQAKNAITQGL